jgi:hypothetical protein
MKSSLIFSIGALALAQASSIPIVAKIDITEDDVAILRALAAAQSEETLDAAFPAPAATADADADLYARGVTKVSTTRSAYPTSFSAIPTDNAGYAAMTSSQHSQWCKTAAKTAAGYSRACTDGYWPTMWERSAAPEDIPAEAVTAPAEPTTFATIVRPSSVSVETEHEDVYLADPSAAHSIDSVVRAADEELGHVRRPRDDAEEDEEEEEAVLQKRSFAKLLEALGRLFGGKTKKVKV